MSVGMYIPDTEHAPEPGLGNRKRVKIIGMGSLSEGKQEVNT